jgi:hypothetical protein
MPGEVKRKGTEFALCLFAGGFVYWQFVTLFPIK